MVLTGIDPCWQVIQQLASFIEELYFQAELIYIPSYLRDRGVSPCAQQSTSIKPFIASGQPACDAPAVKLMEGFMPANLSADIPAVYLHNY